MFALQKSFVVFALNLCASLYIGLGTYGSVLEMRPTLIQSLSVWHSALFLALLLLLILGICCFGALRDRIFAREAAPPAKRGKARSDPGREPAARP